MLKHRRWKRRSFEGSLPCCNLLVYRGILWQQRNLQRAVVNVSSQLLFAAYEYWDGRTYSERAGSVSCPRPAGATVQSHALISYYSKHTSATEGFWIRLSFYLKDVEGKENDFANTNQRPGGRVQYCFSVSLAESAIERVTVIKG